MLNEVKDPCISLLRVYVPESDTPSETIVLPITEDPSYGQPKTQSTNLTNTN